MDLTSQLGGGFTLSSVFSGVSSDVASGRLGNGGCETVSIPSIGGPGSVSGGASLWSHAMQPTTLWEQVLIVILFLSISGLVGFRLAELLSNRDTNVPTLLLPNERGGSDDDSGRCYERIVSSDTPTELLSDEGQVIRLLVENDGRIRQHQIVEETGWSKSKVSRTLSRMNEDGMIEKVSHGRENVITLADRPADGERRSVDADEPLP